MDKMQKRTKYYGLCNNVKLELRAITNSEGEEEMQFEGYAIVFDQPTVLWKDDQGNEYKEIIDRSALKNTDMNDVPMRYNHDTSWVLSRTRKKTGEGSLILSIDDYGLKCKGAFVNNNYSRDVYAMMLANVVDQMSFAFTVRDYSYDSATRTTTIKDIDKLFDVSVVDSPAYPQTSISACRCLEEAEMEMEAKLKAESLEKEKAEAEKLATELENEKRQKLEELKERLNRQVQINSLLNRI